MSDSILGLDAKSLFGEEPSREKQPNQENQKYERMEYISNLIPCVINSNLIPTENTQFEIKLELGSTHNFCMGCYDFTDGRKTARFFSYHGRLCYDCPDDWGREGRTLCNWKLSKPDPYIKTFPHVIRFGNKFVEDVTSGENMRRPPERSFKIKAPFGLFGIVEYKGEGIGLGFVIPPQEIYKIYYLKVFERGKLIAEMIPAKDEKGVWCMYDLVREQFFYPVDETGKRVILDDISTHKKIVKNKVEAKKKGGNDGFLFKLKESLKYSLKNEWNPKYIGGRLEVIHHGEKTKVIAYSTSDNDKLVVWNDGVVVKSASWRGNIIVLFGGFASIYLYGPRNYEIR